MSIAVHPLASDTNMTWSSSVTDLICVAFSYTSSDTKYVVFFLGHACYFLITGSPIL